MRSSYIVCLLLGAVIKYVVTEQEHICGISIKFCGIVLTS